jgi:hypothetical protein
VYQNQREGLRQVIVIQSLNVIKSVALSGRRATQPAAHFQRNEAKGI